MRARLSILIAAVAAAGLLPSAAARADLSLPPPVVVPVGSVPTPTSLTVFGGDVYVVSYAQGVVDQLAVLPGGALGPPVGYAAGFNNPLGVAFGPDGTMFVADSHDSTTVGRSADGRVWAVAPGGGAPQVVIDGLPNGRHNTNGMEVHDGRLYIANGNATDDGVNGGFPEEPLSGSLISLPVGTRGLVITAGSLPTDPLLVNAGLVVNAHGMRNIYDVAFRAGTDDAWIPMNGPDTFDPYGEDLLLKANVTGPAPDFGFPACLYGPGGVTDWEQNPTPGVTATCGSQTLPQQLLGLHASADGLAFGPADSFWHGDLFVAEFGAFFGMPAPTGGHRVLRVPIDPVTGASGTPQVFLPGVTPLDLTFGPAGMYLADFGSGIISLVRPAA